MHCNVLIIVFCGVIITLASGTALHNDDKSEQLIVERKVVKVEQNGPTARLQEYCTVDVQAYSGYDSSCHGANDGFVKLNGNTVWEAGWCSRLENLRGVTVVTVDTHSCTAFSVQRFDTHAAESNAAALATYLKQLSPGAVIVGVTGDEPTANLRPAISTLKSIGVDVGDVKVRGNFAFVLHKNHSFNFQPVVVKGLEIGASSAKLKVRLQEESRTLVQQHVGGTTTFFNRTWAEYKVGFGDVNSNFWIGNDRLVTLTAGEIYKLRAELMAKYDGQWYWAEYNTFRVLGEDTGYVLWVAGFNLSSTAGDSLAYSNGMRFSTKDRDQDDNCGTPACAQGVGTGNNGGFWYKSCSHVYINSPIEGSSGFAWYHLPVGTSGNWLDKKLLISRVYLVLK